MNLSTSEIDDMLSSIEYCTIKDLTYIILGLSSRIDYLERCYIDLDTKQSQLEEQHKGEHNQ